MPAICVQTTLTAYSDSARQIINSANRLNEAVEVVFGPDGATWNRIASFACLRNARQSSIDTDERGSSDSTALASSPRLLDA
ncbi:MAG: hypothetical protein IPK17_30420 [Chloroflexi bacterium]|uniref:hypothetical protein n=1 Tax=Candidatus Flexifilum breve TaxID=3140694 RepID=UPI003135EA73|nr:hypothetical protein [Chloroflexota bacterium]